MAGISNFDKVHTAHTDQYISIPSFNAQMFWLFCHNQDALWSCFHQLANSSRIIGLFID